MERSYLELYLSNTYLVKENYNKADYLENFVNEVRFHVKQLVDNYLNFQRSDKVKVSYYSKVFKDQKKEVIFLTDPDYLNVIGNIIIKYHYDLIGCKRHLEITHFSAIKNFNGILTGYINLDNSEK